MSPPTVIEELDGLRDLAPRLLPGFVATLMRQLILQRAPETLHRRVVIAIALPTHEGNHAELPQGGLICLGTILRSAIGVMHEPPGWTRDVDGLPQGTLHPVRRHPGVHRMTNYLTGVAILHASQIPPPFHGSAHRYYR